MGRSRGEGDHPDPHGGTGLRGRLGQPQRADVLAAAGRGGAGELIPDLHGRPECLRHRRLQLHGPGPPRQDGLGRGQGRCSARGGDEPEARRRGRCRHRTAGSRPVHPGTGQRRRPGRGHAVPGVLPYFRPGLGSVPVGRRHTGQTHDPQHRGELHHPVRRYGRPLRARRRHGDPRGLRGGTAPGPHRPRRPHQQGAGPIQPERQGPGSGQ